MNKKYQQFVPFCFVLAAVLIILVLVLICKPKIEEYSEVMADAARSNVQRAELEAKIKAEEEARQAKEIEMNKLKPIYKTGEMSESESLGVFGNMFEDFIKLAQSNGLLIRSIEYNMKPVKDRIYSEYSSYFNVCELKFFFVGTYGQLQSFLNDTNNNFDYLTSISSLNVSAFKSNSDYLLIKASITLYSEKPQNVKKNRNRKK